MERHESGLPSARLLETGLLRGLHSPVVRDFLDRVTLETFSPGGVVYRESDRADRVFLLVSGRVKVSRQGQEGRTNILFVAGPGELLGTPAIFEPGVQLTTGVAQTTAEVGSLTVDGMRQWFRSFPMALIPFMGLLQRRDQSQNDAHNDMFGLDASARVARAIMREANRFGRRTDEGIRVTTVLSQEDLALHVRSSREGVNRILAGFLQQGWLRRDGGDLVILQEAQLSRRAGLSD